MTTLRDIFTAFAPAYLEHSPPLPTAHRKVISAIQHCQSGDDGPSLLPCHPCGGHHRVNHACRNRPCPQGQQHTTPQWLQHHLEQPLPGPHCLLPFTVPEPLRPFIRSQQRVAYQGLFHATAEARKRLATDGRFLGTDLPGCTGVLHPWGRQLPYHPPIPSIVPGGGLSRDRTTWGPARANCFVPGKALSPIDRALFKEEMSHAGLLEPIAPQGWTVPWNVHRQANHHGHSACPSLAPSVFKVALANHRLVRLPDHTVTCTSRKVGSARLRTAPLAVMAFLRRFRQPVFPEGFMTVRHCGFLHASCALPLATICRRSGQGLPSEASPPPSARGPLSALWRPDGRRDAGVALSQGLCRYRLSARMFP